MSPYPSQINREQIVQQARYMIEQEGLERLALQRLAESLGVQAPSLYRHVRNKTELLRAVNEGTIAQLVDVLNVATVGDTPTDALMNMARAYRAFALANPATYTLAYGNPPEELRPDPADIERMAQPLQTAMAAVTGPERSLAALRGAWAMIHGFVMLEIANQFQRSGSVDEAFEESLRIYIRGLE
jgi:AcrR family transcriptional regulator